MNKNFKTINTETIRSALISEDLPGSEAQKKMLPKGRSLEIKGKQVKESAVLVLLFYKHDELHVCLTKRNSKLKHHPGQISFPGGRKEAGESLLETALRETDEEVGIKSESIEILGQLSSVYVSVSNFNIQPYIGFTSSLPKFTINIDEVEDVIEIPIKEFLDTKNHSTNQINTSKGNLNVPCYSIDNHIIWGATSMMIAELEAILKHYFQHREEY